MGWEGAGWGGGDGGVEKRRSVRGHQGFNKHQSYLGLAPKKDNTSALDSAVLPAARPHFASSVCARRCVACLGMRP